MGFPTFDSYINATTVDMKKAVYPFVRTINTSATSAAGRWHETMSNAAGTGGAMTLTGTAGTGVVMSGSTNGRIPIGADVGGSSTRHLLSATVFSPATTLPPGSAMLVDIIHIYPSITVTGAVSTLSNHPTWTGTGDTRMTNANGVQASLLFTTASSAAGQHTLTYVDQSGNTAQAQSGSLFSPVAAHPAGCFSGAVAVTLTAGPPNMQLGAGDYGVRQVTSYATNTGATSGVGCIILYRPIATIPIFAANQPTPMDFTSGPNPFPRIYDDSCLAFFVNIGGALVANSIIAGELVLGWS